MNPSVQIEQIRSRLLNRSPRRIEWTNLLRAGVLVPVVIDTEQPMLLFTKRTDVVETHKGQVSFPGGVVETADRDIIQTALREAEEEVGISAGQVEIAGVLDDLATPTGFVITPVVGFVRLTRPLTPNPDEVADVFQVPLDFFAASSNARMEYRMVQGKQREVWYYQAELHMIWGATAAIIRSLLSALE